SYDVCFALPFDPHCEKGSCKVYVSGYPLLVGSEEVSTLDFDDADVKLTSSGGSGEWEVCTSKGDPIRVIPSGSRVTGSTIQFSYSFLLESESEGSYEFPELGDFTQDVTVVDSGECGVGDACMDDADCGDFPPQGEDSLNDPPQCGAYSCVDPDAVGAFFGTMLTEDYSSPTWGQCQLGSCSYDIYPCRAYFLGLDITDQTFSLSGLGSISEVSVTLGGVSRDFKLLNPISAAYQGVPIVNGSYFYGPYLVGSTVGPLVIPGSMVGTDSYLFTTLKDSDGNEVTSIAELKFPQDLKGCDSVDLLSDGTVSPSTIRTFSGDEVACYYNSSCPTYGAGADPTANGGYGEVSSCLDVSGMRRVDLNNYGGTINYNLVGLCTNTCGDGLCDSGLNENPNNCRDCCSEYGTGLQESPPVCYSHCGAPLLCDRRELGEVVGDGVCGLKSGVCQYVTDYTEIEEVSVLPESSVINSTCHGQVPDLFCEIWMNYTDSPSISFDLDEGMWSGLDNLPSWFSGLKNVSVFDGDTLRTIGPEDLLPGAVVTIPVNLGRPYGPWVRDYQVRQNNYRATNVKVTIHTLYDSQLGLSRITGRGCYYRSGSGKLCETPPAGVSLSLVADSSDGPASIQAECSVDSISGSVQLSGGVDPSGRYTASGVFEFDPSAMKVGKHTVICSASVPYFYGSQASISLPVFGHLAGVEASLPTEMVPGSSYSLYITKVVDERGQVVPFYTYSWELKQGEISVLLGQTDVVEVPYNFKEGEAELVLKLYADYYDSFTRSFPVTIKVPKQISSSVSPGVVYVPLSGSPNVRVKLLLSNSGPTVNVSLKYSAPKELAVMLPLKQVTVEGFNIDEVPVTIAVPQSYSDTDYVVSFQAYVSGRLQDRVSLRVVQTQQPVYEFDLYPLEQELGLIYDTVTGNVTLTNVGNMRDSYVVKSDMDVSEYDFTLEPGDFKELGVYTSRPGDY
ncbi:MAG: hypothetical protein DRP08_04730, partial [Candidatus Aenigmatarchaeota archaeon]